MSYLSIPIIVVFCYLICEIVKAVFNKYPKVFTYLPIIAMVSGGLLGLIIYLISPEILLHVANHFEAILVGIISGATATGTHQAIKQLLTK